MTTLLLRKECIALLRDGRFLALTLTVLALCATVLAVSLFEHEEVERERRAVESLTRDQWDSQGEKHPHRGAHFGVYVFAPQSSLAVFEPGISAYVGRALWLEPHRRNMTRFSPAADDVFAARLGSFTPAFILTVMLPLLVVAAAYGTVAQERESGTLRMVHAQLLRLRMFLWSKFAALTTTASLVIVAVILLLIVLPSSGEITPDLFARAALLSVVYILYASVLVAVAISVSALSRSSRQAFAALMALWLVFAFIAPRAGAAAATASVPLPDAHAFWAAIRRDYQHGLPGDGDLAARSRAFDAQLLRQHGVQRLEDLPFGAYAVRRLNRDAYADRVHELHFEDLWQRFAAQEAVLRTASVASPTLATRLLSMRLAGTDLAHRRHFEEAAESYRRYFNTRLDAWDAANTKGLRSFEDKYAGNELWRSVERFTYRPPTVAFALQRAAPDLAILFAWLLAAAALLTFSASRLHR